MKFSFDKSLEILQSAPNVISAMLNGLSDEWTTNSWMDGVYFLMYLHRIRPVHLSLLSLSNFLTEAALYVGVGQKGLKC